MWHKIFSVFIRKKLKTTVKAKCEWESGTINSILNVQP